LQQLKKHCMEKKLRMTDERTYERCFHDNYQALCYFALSIVSDESIAEDAVQDVFIRLLHHTESFDNNTHLRNYLYQAVHNRCIDLLRAHARQVSVVPLDCSKPLHDQVHDDETESKMVRAELLRIIAKAIDQLPEKQREVFRLAYIDDLSNEEIAQQMNLSLNTVKVQKYRAKQHLRERLKDIYPLLFIFLKYIS